jgi:cytochrome c oxidase subunit 6b
MGNNVSYCKSDDSGSIGSEPAKPKETLVKEEEAGTHESDGKVKATEAAKQVEEQEDAEEAEEEQPEEEEEEEEAKPEIVVKSTPYDPRFPTTNQARNCYTRYNEFYRCKEQKSEDDDECKFYQRAYRSICPGEWLDKWNEQRENGTWAGKY